VCPSVGPCPGVRAPAPEAVSDDSNLIEAGLYACPSLLLFVCGARMHLPVHTHVQVPAHDGVP
jgi:hypothetical protein